MSSQHFLHNKLPPLLKTIQQKKSRLNLTNELISVYTKPRQIKTGIQIIFNYMGNQLL